jgi:hypothetical protein
MQEPTTKRKVDVTETSGNSSRHYFANSTTAKMTFVFDCRLSLGHVLNDLLDCCFHTGFDDRYIMITAGVTSHQRMLTLQFDFVRGPGCYSFDFVYVFASSEPTGFNSVTPPFIRSDVLPRVIIPVLLSNVNTCTYW